MGMKAYHGNPYDRHTLDDAVLQAESITGFKAKEIYVDRGYRGHDYKGEAEVRIAGRGRKRLKASVRKWLKRRSAIEAVIGHAKTDGRLGRNYLLGRGGRQNQCYTFWLWIQYKEAPEGASFLSVFLQVKIFANGLKYLV